MGLYFEVMPTDEIRIEITSRNDFWKNAFKVEWEYQFPDRVLSEDDDGYFTARSDWLVDLERVAKQCFSIVRRPPESPDRRRLFRRLFPSD